MTPITVKAKISAGFHPGLNANIIKGDEYEMREDQWGDQLFERPSPEWLSPAERLQHAPINPDPVPAVESKQGGKQK